MRRWFVALCLVGLAPAASAGEFELPTLRGSTPFVPAAPTYAPWSGFYAGGHAGYSTANMDFAGATESLVAFMLRELALQNESRPSAWKVLGERDISGAHFGGFVGYNTQWDNVIVGIDLNYSNGTFSADAPATPIARVTSAGGNTYLVNMTGSASMEIRDFASARLRAGWIVANFLPYATVGFAMGRADVARSATVVGAENPPAGYPAVPCDPLANCTEFAFTSSESKKNAWMYGWSAGIGMDVLLMPNLFLRGEYEYVAFSEVFGIKAHINSARVGAGLKF
jgi:opacity protein-like surface antigen